MKGSWVWYEANGLREVQDIETMSEIFNPHRLDDIKRRLLLEGETIEMAAEREGVTVEWMSAWFKEQYQFQVKSALGWVCRWVAYRLIDRCQFFLYSIDPRHKYIQIATNAKMERYRHLSARSGQEVPHSWLTDRC